MSKQRKERSHEFAPPSAYEKPKPKPSYSNNFVKGPQLSPTKTPSNLPKPVPAKKFSKPPPPVLQPKQEEPDFSVPPPGFSVPPPNVPPAHSGPPNPYENEFGPSTSQGHFSPPPVPMSLPKPKMSSHSRLQLHKEMMENWGDSSSSAETRGRGAEIEPPCQMDYYAGSSSKESHAPRLPVAKTSMSEAFACGLTNQLKHFRSQANNQKNNQDKDSDDDSD